MSFATRYVRATAVVGLLCLEAWAGIPAEECHDKAVDRRAAHASSEQSRLSRAPDNEWRMLLAANEAPDQPASGAVHQVAGVEWRLAKVIFDGAVSGLAFGSDSKVTIRFDRAGRVTGRGPINRFSGSARLTDEGRISWTGPGLQTTSMAGPPDAMEQEDLFFQILGQVSSYRVSDSQLILETEDANSSLTFAH